MNKQSWASKMGEEDGVNMGRIYDGMGQLGTWGLSQQAESMEGMDWS